MSTFVMKLEASWFVSYHKPKVERPIRPGVWTVSVQLNPKGNGPVLMETKFLVVPITHENKQPLADPQAVNAKRTVTVKPSMNVEQFAAWRSHVSKSGQHLEQWMDSLVSGHWTIEGYCRTSSMENGCSLARDCLATSWSSFSPDPKSEIGDIKSDGRIR